MSAPERILAWEEYSSQGAYDNPVFRNLWCGPDAPPYTAPDDAATYILATPEALAASPEVRKLIEAEREACAVLARSHSAGYLDGSQKLTDHMRARALWMSLAAADIAAAIRNRKGEGT